MTTKAKTIGYWTTTVFLVLGLAGGGVAFLVRAPANVEGITHLGYPAYLCTILGVWKLLACVALLAPRFPRLKEWAYAGIFFNMTGAAVSHIASGDAAWHAVAPLVFALLALASWALRPQTRIIGRLLAKRTPASVASSDAHPAVSR
jgi:uncharacterized membrane protein YphA (DoxX/SURF4 family)